MRAWLVAVLAGGIAVAEEKLAKKSYDIGLFDVSLPDGDGVRIGGQRRELGE